MGFGIGRDELVVVAGIRGTGKTTLCQVLGEEMAPTAAWDPFGQYRAPIESYRPRSVDDRAEFGRFAGWLYSKPNGCTLLAEEGEQVLPEGPDLEAGASRYFLMGRNEEKRGIVCTRRPQDLTKKIWGLADRVFLFKLEGSVRDGDLAYVRKRIGHADKLAQIQTWIKDPRKGGGLFFMYHDGNLTGPHRLKLHK